MSKTTKLVLTLVTVALLLTTVCGLSSCIFDRAPQACSLVIDDAIENGKVTADKEAYVEGETVILTIIRNAGYELVSIKINGEEKISEVSSDGRKLEFVITEDTSVSAEFRKIATYKLDISVIGGGNVVSDKSVYLTGNTAVLTIAPSTYYRLKSIKVDGVEKIDDVVERDGRLTLSFVVESNAVIVAEFEELPPEDLLVTVNPRVNLNNMVLTLTDEEGNKQYVTVVDGKFTVPAADKGTTYTVTGESRGFEITLGTLLADGTEVEFDPASFLTNNSGTLDIANGSYVVNPEYHKGVNLTPIAPIEGDSWFVARIQISPEDMEALLKSSDEIVAGISLKSDG
ncbi:MAG: hypothetical protein ACI3XL_02465 [Eubacteriales bacterium]